MTEIVLFLLPHAGGHPGVFRHWSRLLPRWIRPVPLGLPGRGAEMSTSPLVDWEAVVDHLCQSALTHRDRPFAIFGHSLGAVAGFELAHALRQRHGLAPVWFCASAAIAPQRHYRHPETKWLTCPSLDVMDRLRTLGGTPSNVLNNEELMALVLPSIRADFHLSGVYAPKCRKPLSNPILVLGGTNDPISNPPENLSGWQDETSASSRVVMIDGGHFFIETHQPMVVELIVHDLKQVMGGSKF